VFFFSTDLRTLIFNRFSIEFYHIEKVAGYFVYSLYNFVVLVDVLKCWVSYGITIECDWCPVVTERITSGRLVSFDLGYLFILTLRCVIPVVCVTNEREKNVVKQHN